MSTVRAKMVVNSLKEHGHCIDGKPSVQYIEVEMNAVYKNGSDENKAFWNATPAGSVKMTINNPAAFGFFKTGAEVYVDFTPVEPK